MVIQGDGMGTLSDYMRLGVYLAAWASLTSRIIKLAFD